MALEEYRRKRKFDRTPEPPPEVKPGETAQPHFVVQKHHATRLHYDFRLEMDGVLKSWAVPKGPTQDPAEKRLAMMTEDHPLDYMRFEGIIPAGNYGAGTVMVWDLGTFEPARGQDPSEGLEKGDLKFILHGQKLRGEFALVRMRSQRPGTRGNEWLLLKKKDEHAAPGWDPEAFDWSVLSQRSLEQIALDAESATWESGRKASTRAGRQGLPRKSDPDADKRAAARRTVEMTRRQAAEEKAGGGESPAGKPVDPSALPGAKPAEMPGKSQPRLANPVSTPPEREDWLFEIKWDGIRAVAFLDAGRLRLQSRTLRDLTRCYPDLAGIPGQVRARTAVLDGEIVTLDSEGRPSFELLQQRMNVVPDQRMLRDYPVYYHAFDLLFLDGHDLRRVPLEQRKQALRAVLPAAPESRLRYSDHVIGHGADLARLAEERGLEGIVGKRRDSVYAGQRSPDWLKIKTTQQAECIVGGYTEPRGGRQHFGSLILGQERDGELRHVANAGSGFTEALQKAVWEKLKALETDDKPFAGQVDIPHGRPHWVRPVMKARVKFVEWTRDGKMRAPVFAGLIAGGIAGAAGAGAPAAAAPRAAAQSDRGARPERGGSAAARPAETPAAGRRRAASGFPAPLFATRKEKETVTVDGRVMAFQNLNKVFFPEDGYVKRDVIEFYYRIADYLLPHVRNKPVTMKRYPDGIHKPFFFQKDAGQHMPKWIRTVPIPSPHGHDQVTDYVVCNDRATLVYLANLGCIDHNLDESSIGTLEHPDFVLFDLDPGEKAAFDTVIEVARAVKEKLDLLGLAGYPKTSGATGLHIFVPLQPVYSFDASRELAHLVYRLASPELKGLITQERSLSRRPRDRVYLDYLQNARGKTVPPPYCLRPHPGAPVSTPLAWDEVKRGLHPGEFNMQTIWTRLEKVGDLFAGVLEKRQRLEPAMERLQEALGEAEPPAAGRRRKRA